MLDVNAESFTKKYFKRVEGMKLAYECEVVGCTRKALERFVELLYLGQFTSDKDLDL